MYGLRGMRGEEMSSQDEVKRRLIHDRPPVDDFTNLKTIARGHTALSFDSTHLNFFAGLGLSRLR